MGVSVLFLALNWHLIKEVNINLKNAVAPIHHRSLSLDVPLIFWSKNYDYASFGNPMGG